MDNCGVTRALYGVKEADSLRLSFEIHADSVCRRSPLSPA